MAGSCIVDDGGDNTTGQTWATAYTSLDSAISGTAPGSGDTVYFGHDHIDQKSYSANYSITGPSTTGPVRYISVTQGTGSIAGGGFIYQPASSLRQVDTSNNGANTYTLTMTGIFAVYGVSLRAGGRNTISGVANYYSIWQDTTFGVGANSDLLLGSAVYYLWARNTTIDLTLDGTTARSSRVLIPSGDMSLVGLSFINPGYRTGDIIEAGNSTGFVAISGADFSGFTNATTPNLVDVNSHTSRLFLLNSKTAATHSLRGTADSWRGGRIEIINVGSGNQPEQRLCEDMFGRLQQSTSVYRSGGATIEGTSYSWGGPTLGIETKSSCSANSPFYTPWILVPITSTGTKTFTVYIQNSTGDFTDAEVWMEVEFKDDASSGFWSLNASDKAATILTSGSAQTDDTSSTWTGEETFKQALVASSLTVGTAGLARVRIGIAVASIAASRDFYIDPQVTVS